MAEVGIHSGLRYLENEITFQIKNSKQKDCLIHELVSGGTEYEFHRGVADRQNNLSVHGRLEVGQYHGCKYNVISRPALYVPCIGVFLNFNNLASSI